MWAMLYHSHHPTATETATENAKGNEKGNAKGNAEETATMTTATEDAIGQRGVDTCLLAGK